MDPAPPMGSSSPLDTPELRPVVRELVRLAKEQGYLTYDDLNETLPDAGTDIELVEDLIERLRTMKFRIIDSSEIDHFKPAPTEGTPAAVEEDSDPAPGKGSSAPREGRLDILDDPVRMYMRQMGQIPLLSREQELTISKRIEKSESEIRKILSRFGFIPGVYIELANRIEQGDERFDRLILDKKVESRPRYLKNLEKLRGQIETLHGNLTETYVELNDPKSEASREALLEVWEKGHAELSRACTRFHFKQHVTEDLIARAETYAARSEALSVRISTASDRGEKAGAAKRTNGF